MNEELKVIITAEIADLQKKLDEAKKQVEGLGKKGEGGFSKFAAGAKKAAGITASVLGVVTGVIGAAGAALVGLANDTREYRTEQAKLNTAFESAGSSALIAKNTYNDLFRVLGDSGQATEAAQHLAKLTTEEKALSEWTNICQGVYATFGDSLPIESLTEAVNHSAQLGEVQGSLADALEWSGVNVDEFNDQLFLCNTESERERLIRDTLNGLYEEAATGYETNAASVLAANEAQNAYNDAQARLGETLEPLVTLLNTGLAGAFNDLAPIMATFAEGMEELVKGVDGGAAKMGDAIGELVTEALNLVLKAVPKILDIALGAVSGIIANISGILPEIARMIPAIVIVLLNNVPVILNAAIELLMGVVEAVGVIIPILLESLPVIVDTIFTNLVESLPIILEGAVALLMSIVDAITVVLPSIVENLPKLTISIAGGLIKAVPDILKAAVTLFGGIITAALQIPGKLVGALASIVTTVKKNLVEKLQSLLKFNWSLPKLKMPSITVKWKNSPAWMAEAAKFLGMQGVPSFGVNWNAMGGVFDKPTVFSYGGSLQGVGEAGAEAVVPLENNLGWLDKLAGMLNARMGNTPVVLQVDKKTLAKTTIGAINELTRQQGKLSLNMV